jgi:glucose-6-phosphate dehydrogenase assembly protein OpcA
VAPDVAALERLEDQEIALDVRAIEEEFARIWRETARASEDQAAVRVRVMNLVAVGSDAADIERFEEVMQVLPQRHPCRGVFAVAASPHERLAATISAHCWRTSTAKRHVCSEEVMITAAPNQERHVASAVLGLLVPDLPVSVWLMGDAAAPGGLAGRLLDAGDSIIVDTGRAASLRDAYAAIRRMSEASDAHCLDLAWARLATWRALVAQLFDGDAGARELDQIVEIAIEGGSAGGVSSEAVLLGAWMASRLDFAPADVAVAADSIVAALYDGTRSVRLRIAPSTTALARIMVRTSDAQFEVELRAESGHMHVRETWDSGSTQRMVDRPPDDEGTMIGQALDSLGELTAYREALDVASTLVDL